MVAEYCATPKSIPPARPPRCPPAAGEGIGELAAAEILYQFVHGRHVIFGKIVVRSVRQVTDEPYVLQSARYALSGQIYELGPINLPHNITFSALN